MIYNSSPKVKICGITNLEDALFCIENGADALGFVFYEKSPRYISPLKAKKIIEKLPPFVENVGLFVECSWEFVNDTCKYTKASLAQIHFDASEEFYDKLSVRYIRVARAKSKDDIDKFKDNYRLVDAFVKEYGGQGKRVDESWFEGRDCSKIILAGGLNEENVKELKEFGFYGYDVSSSVEKEKGIKDMQKVKNFIKAVKEI